MYTPPVGFHFKVEVLGLPRAVDDDVRFTEVSGLSFEVTTEEVPEGGENRFIQRYPVRVKHFMMSESVEVRIHELQKKKAALVKGAIGGVSKEDAKGMRVDELRLLFS